MYRNNNFQVPEDEEDDVGHLLQPDELVSIAWQTSDALVREQKHISNFELLPKILKRFGNGVCDPTLLFSVRSDPTR